MADKPTKKAGRPTKRIIEPIPDTFENVLKAVVKSAPTQSGKQSAPGRYDAKV